MSAVAEQTTPVELPPGLDALLVRLSAVMAAFGHPYRLRILTVMYFAGKPLSPVELAELMHGARLGTVAYHVRTLRDKGLVELTSEARVRGAVKHNYELTEKAVALVEWAVTLA